MKKLNSLALLAALAGPSLHASCARTSAAYCTRSEKARATARCSEAEAGGEPSIESPSSTLPARGESYEVNRGVRTPAPALGWAGSRRAAYRPARYLPLQA